MATPSAPEPKKMPHFIKDLYAQIMAHPRYPATSASFKFGFEMGNVAGGSWCTKENNAWTRAIWKHLYLGESMPAKHGPIFDDEKDTSAPSGEKTV